MATGSRTSGGHKQGCVLAKFIAVRARRLIWTFLLGLLLLALLWSHALLYSRTRKATDRSGFDFPGSGANSSQTLLLFSQFNSAVATERERIKHLMRVTEFGKLSVKEILFSRKPPPGPRRPKSERAWMLPFASRAVQVHMPKVVQLSKDWLGDSGDFNPGVMQDLLRTVKGPLNRNEAYWSSMTGNDQDGVKWGDRYRSCAVVGNSGILLNASYGERIDSHEMVIRLNNAAISGYKNHVGSKTSLSFINSNILRACSMIPDCRCHPYGNDVPIILYICQANHLLHVAKCMSKQKTALLVTHSLLDALCAAIVKWYSVTNFMRKTGRRIEDWDPVHHGDFFHYSSGMQAVVLALGMCDSVDMYGFGKSAGAKHHYHTEQKAELKLHDYAAEYVFYDDLIHNRTIPFLGDAGISMPPVRIFF